MLASSAPRTRRRLPRLSTPIEFWVNRISDWRRAVLALGLLLVTFSLVGMHQLSLDHELAAPTIQAAAAPASDHHHGTTDRDHAADHTTASVMSVSLGESAAQHGTAIGPAEASSSGHDEGCPGCGNHTMALGACLLALTLLVLSWWLAPPRARLLPPRKSARPATLIPRVRRRIPALSLTELSILRT